MSYGFDFTVENKAAAKERLNAELNKVMEQQPIHAKDVPSVMVVANDFLDQLADDETLNVRVSVNGSVSWNGPQETPSVVGAGVSISIHHATRQKPAA